jgi:hypothetical protein
MVVRLRAWPVRVRHARWASTPLVLGVSRLAGVSVREPSGRKSFALAFRENWASLDVLPLLPVW